MTTHHEATDHPLTPERIDAFRDRHIDRHSYAQAIFDAGREHEQANAVTTCPCPVIRDADDCPHLIPTPTCREHGGNA